MRTVAAEPRWGAAAPESSGVAIPAQNADRRFRLCFDSLRDASCVFTFPCDAAGRVDLDGLSDEARLDYLYARMVIGRVFHAPAVRER